MQNIAIESSYNLATIEQDLRPSLFTEFINWIDRSANTARAYIINLRQFIAWLRYSDINRPIRQDILNYREYLNSEHEAIQLSENGNGWQYRTDTSGNKIIVRCKPNTIAQYLRSVCQFFKWTAANNYYPDIAANIHAPKVKHDTHRKEALTAAEVLTVENSITSGAENKIASALAAAKDSQGKAQRATEQSKRLYAMYLLTVTAGLRTIELSRANVKDFEIKGENAFLYVYGKGHTEADTKKALAPEVAAAINDYLQSRKDNPNGSSPLFVSTGNRAKGKRIATTTISTMLKGALKAAGFNSERLTAHSLRHTAGTNAMLLTNDLYKTQQYMRHSNPATTEIYLHVDTEKADIKIAQQLYNAYHNIEQPEQSLKNKIENSIAELDSAQLKQLAAILDTMKAH